MNEKIIILTVLLFGLVHTAVFAKRHGVLMEIHSKSNPEKNLSVNRTSIHLAIEVIYDSDTHKIEVKDNNALEAEVFLYDANRNLESYSSTLNTDFTVLNSETYIIQIQGKGWFAEEKIEV